VSHPGSSPCAGQLERRPIAVHAVVCGVWGRMVAVKEYAAVVCSPRTMRVGAPQRVRRNGPQRPAGSSCQAYAAAKGRRRGVRAGSNERLRSDQRAAQEQVVRMTGGVRPEGYGEITRMGRLFVTVRGRMEEREGGLVAIIGTYPRPTTVVTGRSRPRGNVQRLPVCQAW